MDSIWSLRRSSENSRVAGVCGALAARWHTDPLLVRIVTVLVALSGGIGLVLYAACWLLLPRQGESQSPLEHRFPRATSWSHQTWQVLVVIACVLSFITLSSTLSAGILPTIIVFGAIWWSRRRGSHEPSDRHSSSNPSDRAFWNEDRPVTTDPNHRTPGAGSADAVWAQSSGYTPLSDPFRGADTPFTQSARAWQDRVAQADAGDNPASRYAGTQHDASHPDPRPSTTSAVKTYLTEPDPVGLYGSTPTVTRKIPLSRVIPLTAAVLAAAMLALFIVQLAGVTVSTPLYWGVALLVLGLSCVINAWRSRTGTRGVRWLAVAAIVASLSAVGANFPIVKPASGETLLSYSTAEALPANLEVPSGEATLDLSGLAVTADETASVHMTAGSLEVKLPDTGRVRVIATTKVGEVQVLDQHNEGFNGALDVTDGDGASTLTLNLDVGFGEVRVTR